MEHISEGEADEDRSYVIGANDEGPEASSPEGQTCSLTDQTTVPQLVPSQDLGVVHISEGGADEDQASYIGAYDDDIPPPVSPPSADVDLSEIILDIGIYIYIFSSSMPTRIELKLLANINFHSKIQKYRYFFQFRIFVISFPSFCL